MTDQTPPPVERRQADIVGVTSAKTYLFSALSLTVFMVLTSLVVLVINPEFLDLKQIRYLSYFLTAIIVALFAAAGINVVNVLNGHAATMLRLVGEKERAKGYIEALKDDPNIPIS